ncbi:MAG: 30S ribosomal protein S7 [Candidatus Altiarchaeota archaeon]|nr:30S ribosomal protein S7 [Candidatus Altiarchaeota archaeon]
MEEIKLFGKWDYNVAVEDTSLQKFVNLKPVIIPHTGGKYQKRQFGRAKYNIVERFINKLMIIGHIKASKKHFFSSGRNTGKKMMLMREVEEAFEIIEKRAKKNPIQILINAAQNSAPRAEVTTVEFGGMRSPVGVDVSPLRRLDLALSFLAKGSAQKAIRSKKTPAQAISEELMAAAENDPAKSFAIDRKNMMEKQAEASR